MTFLLVLLHPAVRRAAAYQQQQQRRTAGAFLPSVIRSIYNTGKDVGGGRGSCPLAPSTSTPSAAYWRQRQVQQRRHNQILASIKQPASSPAAGVGGKSGGGAVVRVVEEIKKPARDDRKYRMIWLQNGMQVRTSFSFVGGGWVGGWVVGEM